MKFYVSFSCQSTASRYVTVYGVDEHELQLLDQMLIVINENAKVIGADIKRNCH